MEFELNNRVDAEVKTDRENVLAGAVGAFLFALVGGVIWIILGRIGIIAGISGLIGVVCAIKGYSVFAKCESKKGIVISVIMAALVIIIAWYAGMAWDFYEAAKEWYAEGEIDSKLSYFDCLRSAYLFFEEKEIAWAYFKDLAIGLLFCIIASVSYIGSYSKKLKANETSSIAAANAFTSENMNAAENNDVFDENTEN